MATYIDPRITKPVTDRLVGEAIEAVDEGGGVALPIEITDVTGLQTALDGKGTSNLTLGTTATTALAGNTAIPVVPATLPPTDNSVTNAKVAANAAIALTKLANVAAGTGGLVAGTLQATLQALATRIQALEDAAV